MDNRNSVYASAYARKILGLTKKDLIDLKKLKKTNAQKKQINKHGNYDGTDAGFTSKTVRETQKSTKLKRDQKKPIDKSGNYEGTDAGFTAKFKG